MHQLFSFDFLNTISKQLHDALDALSVTKLDADAVCELRKCQSADSAKQGVYLLYKAGEPVYMGKADDVAARLEEHMIKMQGRQHIDPDEIGYKSILLEKSMSTAANENVLIALFTDRYSGMWNGKGFGPKDPGQERDTTRPSDFDRDHPIRLDIDIPDIDDDETLHSVCHKMKAHLPWVFRFKLNGRKDDTIDLRGVERQPEPLLQAVVDRLGVGWRGAVLSFGMVLYKSRKEYRFGRVVDPRRDEHQT
jgi:hypothetical protein